MMTEDAELIKKREDLKKRIRRGEYRQLVNIIVDGAGRLIQKLSRNPDPLPFWYSLAVIQLVIVLIGVSISLFLGEFYSFDLFLLGLWGVMLGVSSMTLVRIALNMLFDHMLEIGIDSIESVEDLNDLQSRLAVSFNPAKLLGFSLAFGLLFGLSILAIWLTTRGAFFGWGPFIITLALGFQGAIATAHIVVIGLTLPTRLGQYHFKLYSLDPSSSEIIDCLSDLFSNIAYLGAIYIAVYTFGIVALNLPPLVAIIYVILPGWGPLIAFFVISQRILARIISRGKWKTLNALQAKIETLHAQGVFTEEETMDSIKRLVDYHNQIRATRNSALDLRGGLNFLNSLLLPLLAFVLANLDKIVAVFSR
jgi:hypothetical protein